DLLHKGREDELEVFRHRMPLRLHDLHLFTDAQRVMRAHLRSESVLERCDDAAARGVVFWVRARDHEQVERQAHAIAADLHVLLFHDVEQADLDPFREVGQLVDAEDSTVGAWQQPVMDGQLICEIAAFGDLDGVDLTDEIGDRDVGRGELLAIATIATDPRYLDAVAFLGDQVETPAADRFVRVVVDLASCDHRHLLVEQADQGSHDPALRLAALPQHDHVVARDDRVGQLRQYGLVVADDPGEQWFAGAQAGQQVAAHLLLDRLPLVPAGT